MSISIRTCAGFILCAAFASFAAQSPAFEVASIKLVKPPLPPPVYMEGCHGADTSYPDGIRLIPPPLGRCVLTGYTLKGIVAYQSGLRSPSLVLGGPNWADSDRFAIETKAADGVVPSESQLKQMLATLLADQFKLKLHTEKREVSGYALVVQKGGPKFKEATGQERPVGILRGGRFLRGQNVDMAAFAASLSNFVSAPVIDKTGLSGKYTFSIDFTTPDALKLPEATSPDAGVSIFSSVLDLGLKLEAQKVTVEYTIIDSVEKPPDLGRQ